MMTQKVRSSTNDHEDATEPELHTLIHRLSGFIQNAMSTGDAAELRRMRPSDPSAPAFWKVVVEKLEPAGALPEYASNRAERERRWAVILNGLAHLGELHQPGQRFGASLAQAGYSESRLVRLLRSRGEQLLDEARLATRYLVAHRVQTDATRLAWLVLSEGRSDEEEARRGLARDYYRTLTRSGGE